MPTDRSAVEIQLLGKSTNLETVPRCHQDVISTSLQLLNDGPEKRNMGRIVQVNPNGLPYCSESFRFVSQFRFARVNPGVRVRQFVTFLLVNAHCNRTLHAV